MGLGDTVREAAARFGDRTAYVSPTGLSVGYGDLDLLSGEVAAGLSARGIGEGDVVALVLPPCPEYVIAQVALARLGAVTAGVNHRLPAAERSTLLRVARPALVLGAGGHDAPEAPGPGRAAGPSPVDRPGGEPRPWPSTTVTPAPTIEDCMAGIRVPDAPPPEPDPDPHRPVAIVFTSGTTGTPRGAVFAQHQIDFITQVDTGGQWASAVGPAHHGMSGMSLTHLGPTTKLTGNLMRGGTTHLLERWSPSTALALVERHRMPVIAGVPTQVALMLHHPDATSADLSSVRMVVMGGGPASPALVREVRDRLGVPVVVRYSCTEAGVGVGTSPGDDPEDAELTVGRPHEGVELTVRDPTGTPLAPGGEGEVCLRSPAVMSGYWRDPGATAAAMWPDGSVRTGDLGAVDDLGRLRLSGRAGDMYVRGGYNVHPGEVEAALSGCPGVAEIAVVGRPDDLMGAIGVAVVVPTDAAAPPTVDDLRSHGGNRLAGHKLPEAVVVVDELPRTPMEKLDRGALRREIAAAD